MARKQNNLAPINVTQRATNLRTGKVETWEAMTTDGAWCFVRTEDTGTPWHVTRVSDGAQAGQYGTLDRARHAVALRHAEISARVWLAGNTAYLTAKEAGLVHDDALRAKYAAEGTEWTEIRKDPSLVAAMKEK